MSPTKTAIVLIGDKDYLVPMVGTALSALQNVGADKYDVIVHTTDADSSLVAYTNERIGDRGVRVVAIPPEKISQIKKEEFPANDHITVAAMARLWLDDLLTPDVTRFLYLDSDIEITSDIRPLLNMSLHDKSFLAGMDLPFLIEGESGSRAGWYKRYLKGLGLESGSDYFNSGVMLVDRSAWQDIGREAVSFFKKYPERCQYHDQSALNAVAKAQRGKLSPKWNYTTDFMSELDPRTKGFDVALWHYTGFPKPWQASTTPWKPWVADPDRDLISEFGLSLNRGMQALHPLDAGLKPAPRERVDQIAQMDQRMRWRNKWLYPTRSRRRIHKLIAALS